MNTAQIQLRLTLSDQLYDFLLGQANRFGLTVTQVVKHLIIEKAQRDEYPTFMASDSTIKSSQKALEDYKNGKYIAVDNLKEYFDNL
ncbi:MAG: hypothetical protein AAB768_01350 [Patescibacteria group bacterium]